MFSLMDHNNGHEVSGAMQSNLDPFGVCDDPRLWEALKRSHLVDTDKAESLEAPRDTGKSHAATPVTQFTLETVIEDEGNNLSVGQVSISIEVAFPYRLPAFSSFFGKSSGQEYENPCFRRGHRYMSALNYSCFRLKSLLVIQPPSTMKRIDIFKTQLNKNSKIAQ
jgi:hypothetical protein